MVKATLVIEGGAKRGVFASGVLDYLMEKDIYFSNVIGVSMGACNATSYVSKQKGRMKDCIIIKEKQYGYLNDIKACLKQKSLMNMDLLFDKYPNELFPFDYDTYFNSETTCELVTTNCITGKAEYMTETKDRERLMKLCRASSSMPLVSPIVNIDDIPYLDGGIADSIPIKRAQAIGNDKIVLLLTRNPGYRKKGITRGAADIYRRCYKNYPNFIKTAIRRNALYNKQMQYVEKLEREGKVCLIRPLIPTIGRLESNPDTLTNFYEHGYNLMRRDYDKLMKYLEV